jgi:hypothetical protein
MSDDEDVLGNDLDDLEVKVPKVPKDIDEDEELEDEEESLIDDELLDDSETM